MPRSTSATETIRGSKENLSTLERFDVWVGEHFPGALFTGLLQGHLAARQHRVLWDAWLAAQNFMVMPYPGTPKASLGATCKGCDTSVNRSDESCHACGFVFRGRKARENNG